MNIDEKSITPPLVKDTVWFLLNTPSASWNFCSSCWLKISNKKHFAKLLFVCEQPAVGYSLCIEVFQHCFSINHRLRINLFDPSRNRREESSREDLFSTLIHSPGRVKSRSRLLLIFSVLLLLLEEEFSFIAQTFFMIAVAEWLVLIWSFEWAASFIFIRDEWIWI